LQIRVGKNIEHFIDMILRILRCVQTRKVDLNMVIMFKKAFVSAIWTCDASLKLEFL